MKKLLFIMNTMGRAGAERALIALLKQFPPEQYDISLLVLINRGELYSELPENIRLLNQNPDTGSVLSPGGKLAIIKTVLRCFLYHGRGFRLLPYLLRNLIRQCKERKLHPDKLLWRIISDGTPERREHYDLAVAYLEGASTYYLADHVSADRKASFIHIDYRKAGYHPDLDLDTYDQIDRIFSVSKEAGDSFLRLYPGHRDRLFLFRNLLDTERIRSRSQETINPASAWHNHPAKYKLLTVGRLAWQKAYDIAIPTLRILRDQGIDAAWFILGEGPEKKKLRRLIQENGLEDHFILLGGNSNPYPYYREADLYIHATRYEGKSIAIEEAQILGKAIIASDCTGNREQIIHQKNGLLVPLIPEQIADSIRGLLLHPEKRLQFEQESLQTDLSHPEDFPALLELTNSSTKNAYQCMQK